MWTAWHVLDTAPDTRVVLLESGRCGHGPSGRNGGFVSSMDLSLPTLREDYGEAAARAWVDAAARDGRRRRRLVRGRGRRRLVPQGRRAVRLDRTGAGRRRTTPRSTGPPCSRSRPRRRARTATSPVFRGGVFVPRSANVHPARLAFGLRERLIARGAQIHEGSRVTGIRPAPGGVTVRTPSGSVQARTAVIAINAASGDAGAAARPADRLLQPHRLHRAGARRARRAGLARRPVDLRRPGAAALHAHHARRPDRLRLGRRADGGGRAAARTDGRRPRGDRADRGRPAALLPAARRPADGARVGRPDRRLPHAPARRSSACARCRHGRRSASRATASARRTCFGRTLAALSLDRRDAVTRLPFVEPEPRRVPPEPLRIAGAAVIRRALVRKEAAEEARPPAGPRVGRSRGAPGTARTAHRALVPTLSKWTWSPCPEPLVSDRAWTY